MRRLASLMDIGCFLLFITFQIAFGLGCVWMAKQLGEKWG